LTDEERLHINKKDRKVDFKDSTFNLSHKEDEIPIENQTNDMSFESDNNDEIPHYTENKVKQHEQKFIDNLKTFLETNHSVNRPCVPRGLNLDNIETKKIFFGIQVIMTIYDVFTQSMIYCIHPIIRQMYYFHLR
jgi:hypothetical protein